MLSVWIVTTWCCLALSLFSNSVTADKLRICVVDGKGHFKRSQHFCPNLDKQESKAECVVALDRLDCLRKIHKGAADFAVFSPEDLITAQNAGVEILVTNELRTGFDDQEYEVVALINNNSGIKSKYDLKGKRYCHPGYGYENDWTRILANYFEASVAPLMCDQNLTLTENRVKATATFFSEACKAGPWVNNPKLDLLLKDKYPHLCSLCGSPKCSMHDKYWGRMGSLLCLTDDAGDVSWARLDDVKTLFEAPVGTGKVPFNGTSYLCPDDTIVSINTTIPCVWVVKPWSVVASRRTVAQDVQKLVSSLAHNDTGNWKFNLRSLMQITYTDFVKVEPVEPIESYLYRATGYLKANSFSGCHPPRTIRICTTSIIENAKCQWLRESAAVYGIEPDLDCIKADNTTHCMQALEMFAADIVMVPSDFVNQAVSKFNLKPLFYETVLDNEKYLTVAVTRPSTSIYSAHDLKGKKACFPAYDGVAWNTIKHFLKSQNLLSGCPATKAMANFFGPSCTPGLPEGEGNHLKTVCEDQSFDGEYGALHCLTTGAGDVAFISKNSLNKYLSDESEDNPGNRLKMSDFKVACLHNQTCHLSWAPVGQAMVRSDSSQLWLKDTLDVFLQLDELFGKNSKSLTSPFTMYGKFDGASDLLFHDATLRLRSVPTTRDTDDMPFSYEKFVGHDEACKSSSVKDVSLYSTAILGMLAILINVF